MNTFCQMVSREIPETVCDTEQGVLECHGCKAPSRRCLSCGHVRGIVDTITGRCGACAPAMTKGAPSLLPRLDDIILSVATIAETWIPSHRVVAESPVAEKGSVPPSPFSKLPLAAYELLLEHVVERKEKVVVINPKRVLHVRAHLSDTESDKLLTQLVGSGKVSGQAPWTTVGIVDRQVRPPERGDWAGSQESTHSRFRKGAGNRKVLQRQPLPSAMATVPAKALPVAARPPVLPAPSTSCAPSPKPVNVLTCAQVYASLVERSTMLGGERVVRGGVPLVQMRFRIGPADTIASFERLLTLGHIQRKDEWRVITLLSGSSINDASPAFTPPPATVRPRLTTGSVHRGEPRRHLQVVHPQGGQPVVSPPTVPIRTSFDDVMAEVEQRLAHLGVVRDELLRGMAQLEVLLATLRSLRDQMAKTEDLSEQALRETSAAVAQIMERLRHGGSQ